MANPITYALCVSLLVLGIIITVTYYGFMDAAITEDGIDYYAEKNTVFQWPSIPMPLNTAINFGYCFFGLFWMFKYHQLHCRHQITDDDAWMSYVFCLMSALYGPVQMYRIVMQTHKAAIVDQWITLPIFAWVYLWGKYTFFTQVKPDFTYFDNFWNIEVLIVMALSLLSYFLSLFHEFGFELALGLHISLAIYNGVQLYWYQSHIPGTKNSILLAILSCLAFVLLKVYDLHLPSLSPIFNTISGHFLSKVGDCMQIHYVLKFFYCIYSINKPKFE